MPLQQPNMRLAVFGGGGMIGRPVIAEALSRNHHVITADPFPDHTPLENPNLKTVSTDVYTVNQIIDVCLGTDAVIVSHNPPVREQTGLFESVLKRYPFILEGIREAKVPRILFVGEAATLFVKPGIRLMDTGLIGEDFALRMLGVFYLDVLRHEHDIDWVWFSPAARFVSAGHTGKYRLGKDDLIVDADGQSTISLEDYASALLDETDAPVHHRERFTIGY